MRRPTCVLARGRDCLGNPCTGDFQVILVTITSLLWLPWLPGKSPRGESPAATQPRGGILLNYIIRQVQYTPPTEISNLENSDVMAPCAEVKVQILAIAPQQLSNAYLVLDIKWVL